MNKGQRVRLKVDYRHYGFAYSAGQVGTVRYSGSDFSLVDMDGYDAERKADAEFKERHGESPNVSVYLAEIPPSMLEVI